LQSGSDSRAGRANFIIADDEDDEDELYEEAPEEAQDEYQNVMRMATERMNAQSCGSVRTTELGGAARAERPRASRLPAPSRMMMLGECETGPRGPTSQEDIVEAAMAKGDLQTAILAMVMGELSRRRRSGGDDEGADGFDDLRSTRVLQRSRAIKDQMARHPTRVVCEYEANW
jgi:hypothetical protein